MKRRDFLLSALGSALAAHPAVAALASPGGISSAGGQDAATTVVARFGTQPDPETVHKVLAAGPPASVLLAVLAPDKLMGWPMQLSDAARSMLAPVLRDLPVTGRLAGRGSTLSLEQLLQLQPDLILDAGTADATYVSGIQRVSEQTALPTVLIQGRLADHAMQLREVGHLLGVSDRAGVLADYAQGIVDLAARMRASVHYEKRPRVYYGRGIDGLETGLAGSINVEAIEFAGGRNVAAEAGKGTLTRVSLEQILAWDPEVIITQDADFARRVRADALWQSISAVRRQRVHCAPILPFGWLDGPPGINRLIGVRWLLQRLHPTHPIIGALPAFGADVRDFYRLFYGVELSTADMARLFSDVG